VDGVDGPAMGEAGESLEAGKAGEARDQAPDDDFLQRVAEASTGRGLSLGWSSERLQVQVCACGPTRRFPTGDTRRDCSFPPALSELRNLKATGRPLGRGCAAEEVQADDHVPNRPHCRATS